MPERRRALRMPGRVYREFVAIAIAIALSAEPSPPPEQEALCDAVSLARLVRRGVGHTVYVPLGPEQAGLLMEWVTGASPKFVRDYRDVVIRALGELERSGEGK